MNLRLPFTFVLVLLGWIFPCQVRGADIAPEYKLKAAYIYNFTTFVEWPGNASSPLTLCLLGEDSFGPELDRLEGKAVGSRTLAVKRLGKSDSPQKCQILFIAASEEYRLEQIVEQLRQASVLTISDIDHAVSQGVMIGMFQEEKKLYFEVNLQAARRSGITISSRLLRLAKAVY